MLRALTKSKDVTAGIVSAGLGLIFFVAAFQIRQGPSSASVLGPRVFPLTIGAITVACAIALVVRGLRSPDPGEVAADDTGDAQTPDEERQDVAAVPRQDVSQREVVATFAMFTVYIIAFIPLGYLLSTFAFLTGITTYVDRDKLLRNSVFAAVFSVVVYLLFNKGLQVQLPPGILG